MDFDKPLLNGRALKKVQHAITSNSKSKFGSINKKPRRPTRPIAPQGTKSVRREHEALAPEPSVAAAVSKVDFERVRTLSKLMKRHEAAGRHDAAAAVRAQIDGIQSTA